MKDTKVTWFSARNMNLSMVWCWPFSRCEARTALDYCSVDILDPPGGEFTLAFFFSAFLATKKFD